MPKLEPEFANNPEPRCPCVLLLDTSISMSGSSINELNQGLHTFKNDLQDPTALLRVEVAVVTFDDSPRLVHDFVTASNFQPPTLIAQGGSTDMAGGIHTALDLLRSRKEQYKANKVSYFRPWVFMITDGAPNAGWEPAAQRIRDEEHNKGVVFFAIGVEGADMGKLTAIAVRPPWQLRERNFQGLFRWLSASLTKGSQGSVGEQIAMQAPGGAIIIG